MLGWKGLVQTCLDFLDYGWWGGGGGLSKSLVKPWAQQYTNSRTQSDGTLFSDF